jgi:uncharacterized protein YkwD
MKRLLLLLLVGCGPKEVATTPISTNEILDVHNRYRAKHCAPPLRWDEQLEQVAKKWASRCEFEHSSTKHGENLAAGTHGAFGADRVVGMWYDEVELYSFKRGGFSMETGHFTQLVWKDTTRVGCAMAKCPEWDLWVCNYDPPGNVEGGYRSNVRSTGCR